MTNFDQYFTEIYGNRWPELREALIRPPIQGLYANPYLSEAPGRVTSLKRLWDRLWVKEENHSLSPERHSSGLLDIYILDPASVFVADLLEVQESDVVLDMCAAPGGKSLVLFSKGRPRELISNDLSQDRRLRMKKIFEQYIPESERSRLQIKGWDGLQYGMKMAEKFDRILLDAPCSGERHMMESSEDVAEWKVKRAENLARRQYGLLCSALLALKPGGTLVYSTCSINPMENDAVIERLIKRKGEGFEVVEISGPSESEKTRYGLQFLPDVCGFGPMFCCKIRKHEGLSSDGI